MQGLIACECLQVLLKHAVHALHMAKLVENSTGLIDSVRTVLVPCVCQLEGDLLVYLVTSLPVRPLEK